MYPRCCRPQCQDPPVKNNKTHTYCQRNLAFEPGTGTTNKEEPLYSEIPSQPSFNQQHQVPNKEPVFKRHQNETPEGEDDCKNNHYQALKKSNILKANDYQKPKDIGGEPLHVYENVGTHDDHTEV